MLTYYFRQNGDRMGGHNRTWKHLKKAEKFCNKIEKGFNGKYQIFIFITGIRHLYVAGLSI